MNYRFLSNIAADISPVVQRSVRLATLRPSARPVVAIQRLSQRKFWRGSRLNGAKEGDGASSAHTNAEGKEGKSESLAKTLILGVGAISGGLVVGFHQQLFPLFGLEDPFSDKRQTAPLATNNGSGSGFLSGLSQLLPPSLRSFLAGDSQVLRSASGRELRRETSQEGRLFVPAEVVFEEARERTESEDAQSRLVVRYGEKRGGEIREVHQPLLELLEHGPAISVIKALLTGKGLEPASIENGKATPSSEAVNKTGSVILLCGGKGEGKTTLSLRLAYEAAPEDSLFLSLGKPSPFSSTEAPVRSLTTLQTLLSKAEGWLQSTSISEANDRGVSPVIILDGLDSYCEIVEEPQRKMLKQTESSDDIVDDRMAFSVIVRSALRWASSTGAHVIIPTRDPLSKKVVEHMAAEEAELRTREVERARAGEESPSEESSSVQKTAQPTGPVPVHTLILPSVSPSSMLQSIALTVSTASDAAKKRSKESSSKESSSKESASQQDEENVEEDETKVAVPGGDIIATKEAFPIPREASAYLGEVVEFTRGVFGKDLSCLPLVYNTMFALATRAKGATKAGDETAEDEVQERVDRFVEKEYRQLRSLLSWNEFAPVKSSRESTVLSARDGVWLLLDTVSRPKDLGSLASLAAKVKGNLTEESLREEVLRRLREQEGEKENAASGKRFYSESVVRSLPCIAEEFFEGDGLAVWLLLRKGFLSLCDCTEEAQVMEVHRAMRQAQEEQDGGPAVSQEDLPIDELAKMGTCVCVHSGVRAAFARLMGDSDMDAPRDRRREKRELSASSETTERYVDWESRHEEAALVHERRPFRCATGLAFREVVEKQLALANLRRDLRSVHLSLALLEQEQRNVQEAEKKVRELEERGQRKGGEKDRENALRYRIELDALQRNLQVRAEELKSRQEQIRRIHSYWSNKYTQRV